MCRLQHQGAIVDNARGMKDAVDFSEALFCPRNYAAHLVWIGDIRLRNEQSSRDGSYFKQLSNLLLVGVRLQAVVQGAFPVCFRGQWRAADENEPRVEISREMLGDDQSNRAQSSGDEVDASAFQAVARGGSG